MTRGAPLFQGGLRRDPFWMLVACVLVNRTRWSQAEPVLKEIRKRWPSPLALSRVDPAKLKTVIVPLGLAGPRTSNLIGLASDYRYRIIQCRSMGPVRSRDVYDMMGCGHYAADSWAIFVEGRRDVRPTDKELKRYLSGERR